jgi:phosphoribosylglycinamide formyltransferase 1
LADRVLECIEVRIYPQAAAWLARGDLTYHEGKAFFRGRPLETPLTLDDLEPAFA